MGRDIQDLFSIQKWRCSWFLVATIASIVVMVSVVHMFLFRLVPSFNYFKLAQDSCIPANVSAELPSKGVGKNSEPAIDLKHRFPADFHGAVVYRGAPWKAEIGRWLAGCDFITKEVNITEVIGGNSCKNDSSGRGVCNQELGQCRCFHGYTDHLLNLGVPNKSIGQKLTRMCSRLMVANKVGVMWIQLKHMLTKVKFKEECDCKYDGLWGRFCEIPVQSTCIKQCSGHGYCHGGFCQCANGWYGVDCSTSSVITSIREWPSWLHPAQVEVPDNLHSSGKLININAVVAKKRPLIYVYDFPPEFNSLLLEGRHFNLECVNRLYDGNNATLWTDQLYSAQKAPYESILASPHRTSNGEEADFFFVPVLDSCIITRADDAPHLSMQFFSWDEGACYAPKEIWNSMMLVHWGNTNKKHNHSTTAYWADNWDGIPSDKRCKHPCFDPDKDLVLPAWKAPDATALTSKLWSRPHEKRKTLFYFNGNLGRGQT